MIHAERPTLLLTFKPTPLFTGNNGLGKIYRLLLLDQSIKTQM